MLRDKFASGTVGDASQPVPYIVPPVSRLSNELFIVRMPRIILVFACQHQNTVHRAVDNSLHHGNPSSMHICDSRVCGRTRNASGCPSSRLALVWQNGTDDDLYCTEEISHVQVSFLSSGLCRPHPFLSPPARKAVFTRTPVLTCQSIDSFTRNPVFTYQSIDGCTLITFHDVVVPRIEADLSAI